MSLIEDQLSKMDPKQLLKMVQSFIKTSPQIKEKDSTNIQPTTSKSINLQSNKRKIDEEDTNPSHALVYWIGDKKYSTILYKSIDLGDELVASLNKEYNIQFNSKKSYPGKIIMTGSKYECGRHYQNMNTDITESEELEMVEIKTTKKKSTSKESTEIYSLKNKNIQLTDEIEIYKLKMKEIENNNRDPKKEIIDLKKELVDLKKELEEEKVTRETIQNNYSKHCFLFLSKYKLNVFILLKKRNVTKINLFHYRSTV